MTPFERVQQYGDLIEAAARGLKRARHQQHLGPAIARIKAVMAHRFRRQEKAVMAAIKPHIERQLLLHPIREAITPQGRTFASALLPASLQPLSFAASSSEESEYNSAVTDLVTAAGAQLAKEVGAQAGKLQSIAARYLRDNSLSKLTGELDDTSVERLQDALATAWDAGGDYDAMVKAVTDTFEDFSTTRAGLIAQTEGNDAYNEGREATARQMGFDEKSWETESGDPCPVCIDNEGDGWIGIDNTFSSGDAAPTAHPNCMCTLNFRGGGEESTDVAPLRESEAWEDEARNSKGEWTSGGDEAAAQTAKDRVERAKASAVRTGQHEQAIADRSEAVLSQAIGVPRTPNNSAFDLENDDVGIEVKTLVNGKNEKITMSKAALGRKIGALDDRRGYTVVVDRRSGGLTGQATYYYREGFGSFRLGSMTKTTLTELRAVVRGG